MEDNDLKKIWKEMHTGMECKSIDIKEIIHKKHSVVISRILHRQKSLICLFIDEKYLRSHSEILLIPYVITSSARTCLPTAIDVLIMSLFLTSIPSISAVGSASA